MITQSICSLVFVSFVATVLAATPYQNCPADLGVASDVRVTGCNAIPCVLLKGSNMSISVDFTSNAEVDKVTDAVTGIIQNIPVPFQTPHPDACTTKGITCPLKKGQKYTYSSLIHISSLYPSLRLIVQWAIKDPSGKFAFCVRIPAMIK